VGQFSGKDILGNKHSREVSFIHENGFILVDVIFNNKLPMRFIFDTGAQNTILFDKIFADFTAVKYDDKIRILGSDLSGPIIANIGRDVSLGLSDLPKVKRDIIVLDEDYINIQEVVGAEVHGILGTDYFKNLLIEIDYIKSKIKFHNPDLFEYTHLQNFEKIKADIYKNKAYLLSTVTYSGKTPIKAKVLLDTGASVSLLLHLSHNENIVLPEKTITGVLGKGLGGNLEGYIGLISNFQLASFKFDNLISNFQDIDTTMIDMDDVYRDGILGNSLLSRFHIFIDYRKEYLYLKPNRNFKNEFTINKSGLNLIATGKDLNEYVVTDVLENSTGDEAGILKGDVIYSVGPWYNKRSNLSRTLDYLSGKENKEVRIEIKRIVDGQLEKHKFKFRLKNPLLQSTSNIQNPNIESIFPDLDFIVDN
jgi:hypothetical protein